MSMSHQIPYQKSRPFLPREMATTRHQVRCWLLGGALEVSISPAYAGKTNRNRDSCVSVVAGEHSRQLLTLADIRCGYARVPPCETQLDVEVPCAACSKCQP